MTGSTTVVWKRTQEVILFLSLFLIAGFSLVGVPAAHAQDTLKIVEGKVVGSNDQAQSGAIVYLKNGKTNDIKSFISTADGTYRFGQLSPDIDYELWAEYQGRKSPVKTVSSFDSKRHLIYALKVDIAK